MHYDNHHRIMASSIHHHQITAAATRHPVCTEADSYKLRRLPPNLHSFSILLSTQQTNLNLPRQYTRSEPITTSHSYSLVCLLFAKIYIGPNQSIRLIGKSRLTWIELEAMRLCMSSWLILKSTAKVPAGAVLILETHVSRLA